MERADFWARRRGLAAGAVLWVLLLGLAPGATQDDGAGVKKTAAVVAVNPATVAPDQVHGPGRVAAAGYDFDTIRKKAEAGDPHFMALYGVYLKDNLKQYTDAATWLAKAESPIAVLNLGYLRKHGQGMRQDAIQAEALIRRALPGVLKLAQANDPAAQVELGNMLENGTVMTADPRRAFDLYRQAAAQGYPFGFWFLAHAYVDGVGTDRDAQQAVYWLRKAAAAGVAEAAPVVAQLRSWERLSSTVVKAAAGYGCIPWGVSPATAAMALGFPYAMADETQLASFREQRSAMSFLWEKLLGIRLAPPFAMIHDSDHGAHLLFSEGRFRAVVWTLSAEEKTQFRSRLQSLSKEHGGFYLEPREYRRGPDMVTRSLLFSWRDDQGSASLLVAAGPEVLAALALSALESLPVLGVNRPSVLPIGPVDVSTFLARFDAETYPEEQAPHLVSLAYQEDSSQ